MMVDYLGFSRAVLWVAKSVAKTVAKKEKTRVEMMAVKKVALMADQ